MASRSSLVSEPVADYTDRNNAQRLTTAEIKLIETTEKLVGNGMRIPAAQAHFITLQTRLVARQHKEPMNALDIGTFTGYSAGAIAKGMVNGGKVITCDVSSNNSAVAKAYWQSENIAERIEQAIAPAGNTLQGLIDAGRADTFDLIFIDADKNGYDTYYELALKLLRRGGLMILDNMLWSGAVADPTDQEANTNTLRALNDKIARDERVDHILLNAEDGIMLAEKR